MPVNMAGIKRARLETQSVGYPERHPITPKEWDVQILFAAHPLVEILSLGHCCLLKNYRPRRLDSEKPEGPTVSERGRSDTKHFPTDW